ncbi:hypothetical protein C8R42DRAFT_584953, partial [Lentinula raphanica]
RHGLTQTTTGDLEEEEDGDDEEALIHGRRKSKVKFMPSVDTTHTIYYRGHWLRVCSGPTIVARNNDILKKLVLEAKRESDKDAEQRVHTFKNLAAHMSSHC